MPREYNISWNASQRKRLDRAARKYNAAVRKAAKNNPIAAETLPKLVNYNELKNSISTARQLRNTVNRLNRASRTGAMQLVRQDDGSLVTKYEREEFRILKSVKNRKRSMTRKRQAVEKPVGRMGTKKQNELELDNRKAPKMSAGSLRKFLETMEREMLKTDYGSAKLYYDNYIRGLYEVFGGFSEYDNMIARIDVMISYVKSNYPDRLIELLDSGKEQFTIEFIYDPIARDAKLRRIEEAWKTVYDEIEAEETKLPRGKSIFDWSDFVID